MTIEPGGYWKAARHPWACLVFLLPLLVVYEGGVFWLGGERPAALRNGADTWIRWGLEAFGVRAFLAAPGAVVGLLFVWSLMRWDDRPERPVGVAAGMAFESVAFAVGLWLVAQNFAALLSGAGLPMGPTAGRPDAVGRIVTYVGAGIYEEVLFRLVLFAGAAAILKYAQVPGPMAVLLAAVGSAALFAGAHHFGPFGEPFDRYNFLFRTAAGLYFAGLFWWRGFGVAVGRTPGTTCWSAFRSGNDVR